MKKWTLIIATTALLVFGVGVSQLLSRAGYEDTGYKPRTPESVLSAQPEPEKPKRASVADFKIEDLTALTNAERAKVGLNGVSNHVLLNRSAQAKCEDMVAKNYWSHNDPSGRTPWHFWNEAGYAFSKASENLGYGYFNTRDLLKGWMNSASHREAILSAAYTNVGFGVCEGNNYNDTQHSVVIVQHFGTPL